VEAEGRLVAVGVDRLGGARSVVVRGIPAHVAAEAIVAGAAFDEDGVVQLVLAPQALVRAASEPRAAEPRPELAAPPRLLVIDDSLTTRMLEQSILESAGYQVDLAVSGEEGLEMARGCRYGVFIVDVEMPGMNGFEFISEVSADATLRDTPAILVTSRSDPTDKRRGKEVGARAYIVKSEFDQDELIDSIRRLVG
jgi:two-component system chemotaxis sensor kinase CheA